MAIRQALEENLRAELAQLAQSMPLKDARRVVGDLSPEAFARCLGGLPVTRGTVAQVRAGLAAHKTQAA